MDAFGCFENKPDGRKLTGFFFFTHLTGYTPSADSVIIHVQQKPCSVLKGERAQL